MAEQRKHTQSICIKIGAKTMFRIDLFPAGQWDKSAHGRYRLRINRRWHDLPDGGRAYLDAAQIGIIVTSLAAGVDITLPPEPDLPLASPVKAPCRVLAGETLYELTHTVTDPILAHDGHWHVGVHLCGKGFVLMPVDALKIQEKRRR